MSCHIYLYKGIIYTNAVSVISQVYRLYIYVFYMSLCVRLKREKSHAFIIKNIFKEIQNINDSPLVTVLSSSFCVVKQTCTFSTCSLGWQNNNWKYYSCGRHPNPKCCWLPTILHPSSTSLHLHFTVRYFCFCSSQHRC